MTSVQREVNVILASAAAEELRNVIQGSVFFPGDSGYTTAGQAWNLHVQQNPAAIVAAADVADVVAAVRFAGAHNLPVAVMRTGHGAVAPCDGGLLLLTEGLRGVEVDPEARVARVAAGALWADVLPRTLAHGLMPLLGSSPHVGVVGYTLGGGMGWLARKHGLAVDSVRAFDIVTPDGHLRYVTAESEPDLFWAVRGGGGNFGVVTSLEFQVYPLTEVYAGNLIYPIEAASDVLAIYSQWAKTLPEDFTTAFVMVRFPPVPDVPPPLQGKTVCVVRGCYVGSAADGEALLRPMREAAPVIVDVFGPMPTSDMAKISNDPVEPVSVCSWSETLRDLDAETAQTLVRLMASAPDLPFFAIETRHIGGSKAIRAPRQSSAFSLRNADFAVYMLSLLATPQLEPAVRSYYAEAAAALRPYATGMLYYNFLGDIDATPERARATHSPADYRRLAAIKAVYDPANMFRFNPNIAPEAAPIH